MVECNKGNCESRWTKEDIEKTLKEYWSHVDYQVGDWVETCQFLPGIVQKIDVRFNSDPDYDCFKDDVEIFYPHYAFANKSKYKGGSCCSVMHCGVHKITSEYACKLMAIGEDRLKELYDEILDLWNCGLEVAWSDLVEDEYKKIFEDK